MTQQKIAVLVGSLRRESFNRKMAKALIALAPESLKLEIIEIGGLQLYDQDLEDNPPAAWSGFRESLMQFDGFPFVTPEYNRSVPGVLKNAIDVGSRPYGKSVWNNKIQEKGGIEYGGHYQESGVFCNGYSEQAG
jgi:chromate reductase, NAD(P)H dehydrogenase (quinone)